VSEAERLFLEALRELKYSIDALTVEIRHIKELAEQEKDSD